MATFKFYLRNLKAEKETPIILYVSYLERQIKVPTGESLHPKHWNHAEQKVKRSLTGSVELNSRLKTLAEKAESVFRKFMTAGIEPTDDQIRQALKPQKADSPAKDPRELFNEAFETFIEIRKTDKRHFTVQKYKTIQSHINSFSKDKKYPITFESIDLKFYDLFINYLITVKEHTNNTIGKNLVNLKTFLRWATDRNYNTNMTFLKFKVPSEQTDIIYLTEDELTRLYNLDLSKHSTLAKVRDVFCFGCFTGQRFSDIAGLKREDIRDNTWYLRTYKTRDIIEIPLNGYALEILSRYVDKDIPLPVMSNQKTNEYLKDVCKMAEIDQTTTVVRFRGNEKVTDPEKTKKYQFVSTHTARRTFVTLWLEKGGRPETCMEITGHKDYKTFKKYIKITSKVKRVEMDQIWHKEPVMKVS
jgi:integrase